MISRRSLLHASVLALGGVVLAPGCRALEPEARAEVPTFEVPEPASFVRHVTAEGHLKAVEATPVTAPEDSERPMKIAWVAEDGKHVAKGDVVLRFDATEMQRLLRDSQDDVKSANRQISKERATNAAAAEQRDRTAGVAQFELSMAQELHTDDERILSRAEIAETRIDGALAEAKADHAGRVKSVEGAVSRSQVQVHEITRRQAQSEVDRAEASLARLEVTAPHDGILVLERNWRGDPIRVGDSVWRGQKVAEIPLVTTMKAELFVLEADAGDLAEGLAAELVVEAYPDRVVKAEVSQVDTLAKPKDHEVPVQYFGVTLTLESTDTKTMKVGQRVRAKIIIEQPDVLVVPRQAVFERDGKRVVYRKGGNGENGENGFEAVEVQTGSSSAGRIVITEGVEPGEEIALRDPSRAAAELYSGDSEGDEKGASKAGPVP